MKMIALFGSLLLVSLVYSAGCGGKVVVDGPPGGEGGNGGSGGSSTSSGAMCSPPPGGPCYTGPEWSKGVGACKAGIWHCEEGGSSTCVGEVLPAAEICFNGTDDDCNHSIDDPLLCNPECIGCGAAISGEPGEFCPGSEQLYDMLVQCVCAGACAMACSDNVCSGTDASSWCANCLQDSQQGCGDELNACANDI